MPRNLTTSLGCSHILVPSHALSSFSCLLLQNESRRRASFGAYFSYGGSDCASEDTRESNFSPSWFHSKPVKQEWSAFADACSFLSVCSRRLSSRYTRSANGKGVAFSMTAGAVKLSP